MSTVDLEVSIGRLTLENPVMVASGTFGYGSEYAGFVDVNALGAVVTKGISIAPTDGNPAPRTVETPSGMLNAIGLQNPGFEVFEKEKMPFLRKLRSKTIVNFFGSTVEEYSELAGRLDSVEGVDALEVNISCPNIKQGGLAFGSDPKTAALVARAVLERTKKPVLVKLSPNVTDIVEIARAVADTGVDGLTLINTLRGMAVDYRSGRALLGNVIGGLSGPAIRPVAVRAVYEVAQALQVPVVGCGGIVEWPDAVEFLRAGACAVQVGSATFRKPAAALEVLQGLEAFLKEAGHASVGDLVSTVKVRLRDGVHP
jgi:dihydroorotate dehydrogenase (NAD+) catalytic subunit